MDSTGFLLQGRGHGIPHGLTTQLTTSKRHDHTDDQSKKKQDKQMQIGGQEGSCGAHRRVGGV